jgi:hypothetical protein
MAAHQEFLWPPARTFVAAYKENLMAADKPGAKQATGQRSRASVGLFRCDGRGSSLVPATVARCDAPARHDTWCERRLAGAGCPLACR